MSPSSYSQNCTERLERFSQQHFVAFFIFSHIPSLNHTPKTNVCTTSFAKRFTGSISTIKPAQLYYTGDLALVNVLGIIVSFPEELRQFGACGPLQFVMINILGKQPKTISVRQYVTVITYHFTKLTMAIAVTN